MQNLHGWGGEQGENPASSLRHLKNVHFPCHLKAPYVRLCGVYWHANGWQTTIHKALIVWGMKSGLTWSKPQKTVMQYEPQDKQKTIITLNSKGKVFNSWAACLQHNTWQKGQMTYLLLFVFNCNCLPDFVLTCQNQGLVILLVGFYIGNKK